MSFFKRKIGILRKVVQLSKLCDKNVLLYIYDDEHQRMYEYKNTEEFNLKCVQSLMSTDQQNEKFPVK